MKTIIFKRLCKAIWESENVSISPVKGLRINILSKTELLKNKAESKTQKYATEMIINKYLLIVLLIIKLIMTITPTIHPMRQAILIGIYIIPEVEIKSGIIFIKIK